MKTRIILFLAISALITLSFSFVSVKQNAKVEEKTQKQFVQNDEPIGGLMSEDKL
ncbi:MAG TPA: hypothetical protein VIM65_15480 [Cyclobacteriaceae bacterium]